MFDNLTIDKLAFYVYALVNPISKKVFYIGKGNNNRVFAHIQEILEGKSQINSTKKKEIKEILDSGNQIEHYIIRHGLNEKEAFLIESVLIDFTSELIYELTNEVRGHHSNFYGIKTSEELMRQYNAPMLQYVSDPIIIINVNKRYQDVKSKSFSTYQITKEAWIIGEKRRKEVKYALAEFQGIIIGVFLIQKWYPVVTKNNSNNNRWGFEGIEAPEEIKLKYLNKSIIHAKKKGAANPIRYSI